MDLITEIKTEIMQCSRYDNDDTIYIVGMHLMEKRQSITAQ
jgi:hypothetical protein